MSQAQAKRDQNKVPTLLAVDTNGDTQPMRVDPSTSRLLIEIVAVTDSTPSTLAVKRDENRVHVGCAVTDDGSATVTPLIVDNRNGYLFVDLVTE